MAGKDHHHLLPSQAGLVADWPVAIGVGSVSKRNAEAWHFQSDALLCPFLLGCYCLQSIANFGSDHPLALGNHYPVDSGSLESPFGPHEMEGTGDHAASAP
jgi:hypothetical protein